MNRFLLATLLLLPTMHHAQESPSRIVLAKDVERTTLFTVGADVTAPQLHAISFTDLYSEQCSRKYEDDATFSLIVDEQGRARNVYFLSGEGNQLDRVATRLAILNQYTPAQHHGSAVAVEGVLKVHFSACIVRGTDAAGQSTDLIKLTSIPQLSFTPSSTSLPNVELLAYKIDPASGDPVLQYPKIAQGTITRPVLIYQEDIKFPPDKRTGTKLNMCMVQFTVGTDGKTHDLSVLHCSDPAFAQSSLEATRKYRFTPATQNGLPVPARISVEVSFHLVP